MLSADCSFRIEAVTYATPPPGVWAQAEDVRTPTKPPVVQPIKSMRIGELAFQLYVEDTKVYQQ